MHGQTPSAGKLLSHAYRTILKRMWLKNATYTVALSAGIIAGATGEARACTACGQAGAIHSGETGGEGFDTAAPSVESTTYGTRAPDADGSYASLHPTDLAGVFPTFTPSTVSRNLGSQTGVFYYFHAEGAKTMDQEMTGGMTWHTRLAQVADSVRSYYAQASGGLLDIRYTIIDVPLPAKADGTPWTAAAAQNAIVPGLGVTLSDYTFVANYFGPGSASVITNPNTAAGSGGLGSVGGPTGTGQIQTWQNGTIASAVIHELGHNMGFSHSRSVETTGATPTYAYDYTAKTYVATSGMGATTIRNLPIGSSYTEYGNPYSLMGAYPPDNSLTPRQKQSAGWMTQSNFANLNALNPAGGVNTVKIYDDMVDHTVVTNGASGDALRYGVATGYGNVTYGAYLVRPADTFHITGTGATATGKWQAYQQTLEFYYRSHVSGYEGIDGGAPTNTAGLVVTLGGAYMGVLKVGQTFLEKDFSQSLFMPTGGGGVGAVPGFNLDDASSLNGINTDITSYGASSPLNPNRYRSIWYQLTLVDIGADGLGHWANLQVQSFTGAQVYGWQWDATAGTAGAQDGSGTWTTGAGNWRSVSMALDDQNWTAGEDAVFGAGSGAAGTVTLGGNISVNSVAFKAAGSGNYTIVGNGNTLTIDVGGINAESSATVAAPVTLSSQQLWSVSAGQTLNVTGTIAAGGNTLYKSGQGTLALGGVNTWTGQLQVGEGTVRQDANQTFNTTLRIGEAGVYVVNAGTLAIGSGVNIAGMDYGPLDGIQLASLGTLELGSTGSTSANPDLNFLGSATVSTLVQVDAGTHHLNGVTNTVTITGTISGNGTLVKQGAGTLILSGNNTFTGNMTVNAGSLVLNSLGATGGLPALTLNTGGTFILGAPFVGRTASVGNLSGTGGVITTTYGTGAGVRTLGVNQTTDGVFAGTLTGETAGGRQIGLLKSGAATLTLTGANTHTGTTTVSAGTLQIGNGGASGTLGSGAVVNNATLAFNRSDAVTVANAVSGAGSLVKLGSGTTTLTGANTYSGATTVSAGTLKAGAANAFGLNSALTLANTAGARLDLAGFSHAFGSLSGGGSAGGDIALGSAALTTGANDASTAYAGVVSGTGSLVKTGSGTLSLSGKNTYTGATTVRAGTLNLDFSSGAQTGDLVASGSALVMNGGTLAVTGRSGAAVTQTFAGTTVTAGASTLALVRNGATSLDVNLGAITRDSGGTINFTGATGAATGARFLTTTGTAGALLDGGAQWSMYDGADWAAKDATNAFVVAYTGYADVATNGGVIPASSAANVRITEGGAGTNSLAATTTAVNSVLMSAGTTAALINTAGKTLVAPGIAVASGAKALVVGAQANDGALTAPGTLALIANNASPAQGLVINARIQDGAGGGVVSLAVSGGAGGGVVTLGGDNTYTGSTAVTNGGTLRIGSGGATGRLGSGAVGVAAGSTLALDRSDAAGVVANALSGAGAIVQAGTGTTTLTGANTHSGTTTISAGTLQIGAGGSAGTLGSGAVVNNGTLAFNRSDALTAANAVSGTGALVKLGSGTTTLTGANTYSGTTTISAGTLQIGAGGSSGTLGSGAVVNNGALVINRSDAHTLSNAISGAGSLAQTGAGALTLTGDGTRTGLTTVSYSTLQVGSGGASGSFGSGAVELDGGTLVFNRSDTLAVSGAISGNGYLTQSGTGTLVLAADNTYFGQTTIAAGGTLRVGAGGSAGTLGGGTLVNNGALVFNRSDATVAYNVISGAGTLGQSGTGTLTLSGASNFTGNVAVNSGTLVLGNNAALGAANAAATKVAVASGATLDVRGYANVAYGVTIAGTGVGGLGALVNNGAATNAANTQTPNITLAADASLGGTGDFAQIASGFGANTLNLAGYTLTKTGANTFSLANTAITAGTVNIASGTISQLRASNGSAAAFILADTAGATLALNNYGLSLGSLAGGGATGGNVSLGSGALTVGALNASTAYAGIISGTGSLTKTGTGAAAGASSLTLSGLNTYTGATNIRGGVISVNKLADGGLASGIGASSNAAANLDLGAGTGLTSATLEYTGSGDSTDRLFTLSSTLPTIIANNGTGALNFTNTGAIAGSANRALRLAGSNTATNTFAPQLTSANISTLAKDGAGRWIVSGANTYTGGTTINAGTLVAGSNTAFGTGTITVNSGGVLNTGLAGAGMTLGNTITLASGATLMGAGTLTKALTVVAGATVSPGNSPGTITLAAGATFATGSVYEWQIQGAAPSVAGTDFDRIVVTGGTFVVNSGALLKVSSLGLDYSGAFWDSSHAFTLITASSAITGSFTLDTTLAGTFAGQGSWNLATSGNNMLAQWTAVPEPSTYGLLGAGALAAAAIVRRRRKIAA